MNLSQRLIDKCTIVITCCASSSVLCPSVIVNFSHFQILLWNRWTEFNKTWQEARSQCPLPSLCFGGWLKKHDGCPILWLAETFFTFPLCFAGWSKKTRWPPRPLICWDFFDFSSETTTEFNKTWQQARSGRPLLSLCFLCGSEKQDCHPSLWLADTFTSSPLKLLRNLTGSKISTSSTKFVFFGLIEKQDGHPGRSAKKVAHSTQVHDMWPFGPLVSASEPKDQVHYCVHALSVIVNFSYFWLFLWNRLTEFKTWQEARSQRPLPSLCFLGWPEPSLWLAETFSISPLKPMNGMSF